MVATLNSGPYISAGNLIGGTPGGLPQNTNPSAGPNMDYHGDSFLDVRTTPIAKEWTDHHGIIPAYFVTQQVLALNAIPVTKSTSNIAAGAHPASGTAFTLATTAVAGIALNIPFLPLNSSTVVTAPITVDFGYEVVTTVSGSKNVTVANSANYSVGQPIVIASGLTATTPLITYVTGITSATVITIATAAGNSSSTLTATGNGNNYGIIDGLAGSISTYASPYTFAGPGLYFDPTQAISRCLSATGVSGGSGGTITFVGWDIYGQPQTDLITLAAGVNTVNTLKAFKYLKSVTPNFTDTNNVSIGTSDTLGLPLRSDLFEQTLIYDAAALITATTGYVKADATSPATNATGDTRGTYALQTASNGTNRTVIYQFPSLLQLARSGPSNYTSLYGVTPV